jgi:hypothetical protein
MALTPIRCGTQLALVAGIVWLTAGPSAQGLGDIARKEAARRQQVANGKKYTNEDLQPVTPATPLPASADSAPAAGDAPEKKVDAADGGEARDEAAAPQAREKRDEKYWRDRSGLLRVKLNESHTKVKALQQRLEELEKDLADGGNSSQSRERAVTLKALDEAQTDYGYMQEEWKRMEDRARAAKVPEEWIE